MTALVEQVSEPAERARLEAGRVRLLDQLAQQADARAQHASDLCVQRVTGLVPPLLAFAAAGVGAVIGWRPLQHNRQQLQETLKAGQHERALSRSAQLAERFTRAVDQLGAEHLDVRLGGIYALEQIAKDHLKEGEPVYRGTIAEVLTAFVRGHAPWQEDATAGADAPHADVADATASARLVRQAEPPEPQQTSELQVRAADVQAAMTVLGRLPEGHQPGFLDLHGVDLRRADLAEAHLEGADLLKAHLKNATLHDANLKGADLSGANLQAAYLWGAHLEGAHLWGAMLQDAILVEANLQGTHADERTSWPEGLDVAALGVIVAGPDAKYL